MAYTQCVDELDCCACMCKVSTSHLLGLLLQNTLQEIKPTIKHLQDYKWVTLNPGTLQIEDLCCKNTKPLNLEKKRLCDLGPMVRVQ